MVFPHVGIADFEDQILTLILGSVKSRDVTRSWRTCKRKSTLKTKRLINQLPSQSAVPAGQIFHLKFVQRKISLPSSSFLPFFCLMTIVISWLEVNTFQDEKWYLFIKRITFFFEYFTTYKTHRTRKIRWQYKRNTCSNISIWDSFFWSFVSFKCKYLRTYLVKYVYKENIRIISPINRYVEIFTLS